MTEEAYPYVPRHHTGQKIEQAGGSCPIYLTYNLSKEGKPENITAYAEQQVCEYFFKSAQKALLSSKFSVGAPESGCEHEYTFSLE